MKIQNPKQNKAQIKINTIDQPTRISSWNFHRMTIDALCDYLKTNPREGLTSEEANKRYNRTNQNLQTTKFGQKMKIVKILWAIMCLQLILHCTLLIFWPNYVKERKIQFRITTGIVAIIVLILLSQIRTLQIKIMISDTHGNLIVVERDDQNVNVDPHQIVEGDIVFIKQGDIVPCDMVIIDNNNLILNTSALNVQNEQIKIDLLVKPTLSILQSQNVALYKCRCISGSATGICFQTGRNTIMGQTEWKADTRYIQNGKIVIMTILLTLFIIGSIGFMLQQGQIFISISINIFILFLAMLLMFQIRQDLKSEKCTCHSQDNVQQNSAQTARQVQRLHNELSQIIQRNQGSMDVEWTNQDIINEMKNQKSTMDRINLIKQTQDYKLVKLSQIGPNIPVKNIQNVNKYRPKAKAEQVQYEKPQKQRSWSHYEVMEIPLHKQ